MPDSSPGGTRRRPAFMSALVAGLVVSMITLPFGASAATAASEIQPLPDNLEAVRAQEATALYGSPEIRPRDERATSLITMGDSEISGEGVGNYIPGTHQDGNWCDRSYNQAVFQIEVDIQERYNVACSGAQPKHMIYGGEQQYANELNQGDYLAIKARNTNLKLIWVVAGANGDGSIAFGPVVTDCTLSRFFFLGTCWEDYSNQWSARVEVSRTNVEDGLNSIKQTMADAGYEPEDYKLVLQSYPSPVSPDVEDNPNFPGWYSGGCILYLEDMAFARNKAVPMFEGAMRRAAENTGVRYLDDSRLFAGHEVCSDLTRVRGFTLEFGIWDENAARQSYHPNKGGHYMFANCMRQFYESDLQVASCVDPNGAGTGELREGLLEFKQLWNHRLGKCLDASGYNSTNMTTFEPHVCHGGRNQGFYYDSEYQSINIELNHDRCLSIVGGEVREGDVVLHECDGDDSKRWVFEGDNIKPASNPDLCLGFAPDPSEGLAGLRVIKCNPNSLRQRWTFESRNIDNPLGYGYNDWIGTDTY